MRKLKYIIVLIIVAFISTHRVEAFPLQYGKVIDTYNSKVVIKYVSIEKSSRYLCDIHTLACATTNKDYITRNKRDELPNNLIKKIKDFFAEEDIETTTFDINSYTTLQNLKYDDTKSFYISNSKDNPYDWQLHHTDSFRDTDEIVASNVSYVDPIQKVESGIVFNQLQKNGYGPVIYNVNKKELQYFKIKNIDTKKPEIGDKVVKIENAYNVIMEPKKIDINKKYTLVIWLHGGPPRQTSLVWHPYLSYGTYDVMLQALQKNNVIVTKLDYSGSFGYGNDYLENIKGNVGINDVNDVVNTIEYMKKNYAINKVYLIGNSYGGYLSLKALVEKPELIDGVLSINGVTDWASLMSFYKKTPFHEHFNGQPGKENVALYEQANITNKIKNIGKQKIKIIQGSADKTVQPWQATMLYNKLKSARKNVTLKMYAKQDHVFTSPTVITDLCKQMLTFTGITNTKDCK